VLAWALADALPRTELKTQLAAAGLLEPERYLALATYLIVINSVLEEYVYRWFIFRKWEVLVGGHAAVLLAAAVFTVHHVILMGAYFSAWVAALAGTGVFAGGVLWSFLYLRYRSLWPGYVSHALVDVAILTVGWALL
jgi:membrane protease YdiL (CAAX protease family)